MYFRLAACLAVLGLASACSAPPAVSRVATGSLRAQAVAPEVDYSFQTADGLKLKARLTMPASVKGPVPVVVFVGGSGAWDSNYVATLPSGKTWEIMPIRDLAQQCAASGLAFVRYQKRGVSDPGGVPNADWKSMQLHNLLSDAETILAKVKADPRIDGHRIAMVGHSEGTAISTWVAGHDEDVKAFGLLGLARENLHDLIHFQLVQSPVVATFNAFDVSPQDSFLDEAEITKAIAKGATFPNWQALDVDHDGRLSRPELTTALEANFVSFEKAVASGRAEDMVLNKPAGWWREHFAHESAGEAWKSIRTPVLVLQGKADTNTPFETEAVPFEAQLTKQAHPDHRMVGFDGLNHEFEDAGGTSHAGDAFRQLVPWLSGHLGTAKAQ